MSIEDFWVDLRDTAGFQSVAFPTRPSDDDPGALEFWEQDVLVWLSPRTVERFHVEDFGFLGQARQAELAETVERFRTIAAQVPLNGPVTLEQEQEGRATLVHLLAMLEPRRFQDAQSFRSDEELKRFLHGRLPDWVAEVSCETDEDHTGEPIFRIWVDVTEAAVDEGKLALEGLAIHRVIAAAYRRTWNRRWPSIHFRGLDAARRAKGVSA